MYLAIVVLVTSIAMVLNSVTAARAEEGNTLYACSFRTNSRLFTIDPISGEETEIGRMGVEATDIAFSGNRLYGISFTTFFQVNPQTGEASSIVPHGFNDLNSLIAAGPTDLDGFYAAAVRDDKGRGGRFVRIDGRTGKATQIGNLGAGLTSMGDFAYLNGRLYISLIRQGSETTWLGVVNPATGKATLVADTGEEGIYGLEVRNGILFGASRDGVIMHINPSDGKCTRLGSDGIVFGGLAKSP